MPFSEKTKLEVKTKAHFRCCRCQNIGVQVHHILPEKDGGTDEIDNAAPLCPTCHGHFGDNPQKRKEIRQMRDWWCFFCEKKYSPGQPYDPDQAKKIDTLLELAQTDQKDMNALKTTLKEITSQFLDKMNPLNAASAATAISEITSIAHLEPKLKHFCHVYWDMDHDMRCLTCRKLLKPSTFDPTIFFCSFCDKKHQLCLPNGTKVTEEEARRLLKEKERQEIWQFWQEQVD